LHYPVETAFEIYRQRYALRNGLVSPASAIRNLARA
jgi:hypothetical protein